MRTRRTEDMRQPTSQMVLTSITLLQLSKRTDKRHEMRHAAHKAFKVQKAQPSDNHECAWQRVRPQAETVAGEGQETPRGSKLESKAVETKPARHGGSPAPAGVALLEERVTHGDADRERGLRRLDLRGRDLGDRRHA